MTFTSHTYDKLWIRNYVQLSLKMYLFISNIIIIIKIQCCKIYWFTMSLTYVVIRQVSLHHSAVHSWNSPTTSHRNYLSEWINTWSHSAIHGRRLCFHSPIVLHTLLCYIRFVLFVLWIKKGQAENYSPLFQLLLLLLSLLEEISMAVFDN